MRISDWRSDVCSSDLGDMPGYGFAKAPKDVVRKWRFLINDYLRGRAGLKRTLVLIDSRHGIKDVDRDVLEMLDTAAVSYRLVLTKADKIKATELEAVQAATEAEARKHPAAHQIGRGACRERVYTYV